MTTYLAGIGKTKSEVIANPCGLVAKTFFNDTFEINNVYLNENGIAWPTDIKHKYQKAENHEAQWMDPSDEHFMVWSRTSGTVDFRKLWARSDTNI